MSIDLRADQQQRLENSMRMKRLTRFRSRLNSTQCYLPAGRDRALQLRFRLMPLRFLPIHENWERCSLVARPTRVGVAVVDAGHECRRFRIAEVDPAANETLARASWPIRPIGAPRYRPGSADPGADWLAPAFGPAACGLTPDPRI